ncbi:MAG: IPTL-CTERM sorting domain-containing protein, partial [Candidatus Zixiibacteriota bacterium]
AKGVIQGHVQSMSTGMFYELAHGGSGSFANGCIGGTSYEFTTASNIESWIASYPKMRFAFIGSCGGMCNTGDNTFSYEFRKGSVTNTATVGYCGMAETYCALCWDYSISWQDALFNYMYQGWTVKAAFDQAMADYPACADTNNCMRFAGDENFSGPYYRVSNPVPTLSEWGMLILALLLLAVGTVAVVRRKRVVAKV